MTPDHVILIGFCLLVLVALVAVSRNGACTTRKMCVGICFLVGFSAFSIGLHTYLETGGTAVMPHGAWISFADVGLGILFLSLAGLGLLCCSREHRHHEDHPTAHRAITHRD